MQVTAHAASVSLDLALPWILSEEPASRSEKSDRIPRLGRRNLFLLACRECFRDGELDARENHLLQTLVRMLRLSPQDAQRMAALAQSEIRSGKVSKGGALDVEKLYLKASSLALRDGTIDEREGRLLEGLGKVLGFDEMRCEGLRARLMPRPGPVEAEDSMEDGISGPHEAAAEPARVEQPPVLEVSLPDMPQGLTSTMTMADGRTGGNWMANQRWIKERERAQKQQQQVKARSRTPAPVSEARTVPAGLPAWMMPAVAGLLVVLLYSFFAG